VNTTVGKNCPYCQTPIKPGVEVVVCPACDIPHHAECWRENGGCTTYGCSGVSTPGRFDYSPAPVTRAPVSAAAETPPAWPILLAVLIVIYVLIVAFSVCSEAQRDDPIETSHSSSWYDDSYDSGTEDEYVYEEDDSESDLDEDDTGYLEEDTTIDEDDAEYDEPDIDEYEDDWGDEYEDDDGGY
jgi:hypothetical protein